MQISSGIDLVEVARIAGLIERGPKFLSRVFTAAEIDYCQSQKNAALHFAARFAAKEALIKALALEKPAALAWREIEVQRRPHGAPVLSLSGNAALVAARQKVTQVSLSLSHTKEQAIAVVILMKE